MGHGDLQSTELVRHPRTDLVGLHALGVESFAAGV
jgi:hypothetical protein